MILSSDKHSFLFLFLFFEHLEVVLSKANQVDLVNCDIDHPFFFLKET